MNKVVAVSLLVLLGIIGFSAYAYTVYLPSLSPSTTGSTGLGNSGSGTLNIYMADAPPSNATLKYLLINVTSVTIKYSSNTTEGTTTTSTSSTGSSSVSSSSSATTGATSTTSTASSSSSTSTESQNQTENRFVFNVPSSKGLNVNLTALHGNQVLLGAPKVPAGNVTGIILNITGAEAFWTNGNHSQLKVVADGKLMINAHFIVQSNGSTNLTLDINPGAIHVSPGNMSVLRPVVMVTAVSTGPNGTTTTVTTETQSETSSSTST